MWTIRILLWIKVYLRQTGVNFKGGKAIGATFRQFALSIGLPETIVDKNYLCLLKHP